MKCYQLIGSMIATFSLSEDKCISIAFAPTFWLELLNDKPSLEDFALEDAVLANRLKKMRKGADQSDQTHWPEDEKW